jgi:hypothetical protein
MGGGGIKNLEKRLKFGSRGIKNWRGGIKK